LEKTSKTIDRFLQLLKMKGAQPASLMASEFGMTVEGARLQLAKLAEEGLVEQIISSKGVGRPTILYRLSEKGNRRFPDSHPELAVQILTTVQHVLGQNALNAIINSSAVAADSKYAAQLHGAGSLEEKLDRLATVRSEEGYMAEWKKEGDCYLFIENHCPISSAAKHCQGFCQAELNTFHNILGPEVSIERTEYLMNNARRCAYRISYVTITGVN
jgi:predicted ArsR family transcriptional regulator